MRKKGTICGKNYSLCGLRRGNGDGAAVKVDYVYSGYGWNVLWYIRRQINYVSLERMRFSIYTIVFLKK